MKAIYKPRVVDARLLGNGNWLVTDGDVRQVYQPTEFGRCFELSAQEPMTLCPGCGTTPYWLTINTGRETVSELRCACR